MRKPLARRPLENRLGLMPVGLDAVVVRSLIVLGNFKKFIKQVKNLFVLVRMSNNVKCLSIPIRFIITFSFFFVFSPFLVEDASAFSFQSISNKNHGVVLVSKEFTNKIDISGTVFRKNTSFEYVFEEKKAWLKLIKSCPLFFLEIPPDYKYDSNNKDDNANKNTKKSNNITKAERSEILKIWLNVVQMLCLAITLFIIFWCTR